MKKVLILLLLVLGLTTGTQAAIILNMFGGVLYGPNTSSPLPAGTLIQLVVSRSANGFDTPTVGSFTGNSADDQVLFSFVVDNSQGANGTYGTPPLTFSLGNGIDTGDQLLLRWWPGLTAASAAPAAGQTFGQFRTDIVQDLSDITWNVPGDGSNVFLNFFTQSQGGANPESAGLANMTVLAIPEPTTYALLLVGLAGAVFVRRRIKVA
jgi:hypothetical protein